MPEIIFLSWFFFSFFFSKSINLALIDGHRCHFETNMCSFILDKSSSSSVYPLLVFWFSFGYFVVAILVVQFDGWQTEINRNIYSNLNFTLSINSA